MLKASLSTAPELTSRAPVYFDANPLSDRHLTGIGRYAARLALAMARFRSVLFFSKNDVIDPPPGMEWSQDQDLGVWARKLMRGERRPLGNPPPGSLGVWPMLRPIERTFDHEVSILHDLTPLLLPGTHKEITRSHFQGLCSKAVVSSDLAIAVSYSTAADASWLTAIDSDRIVVAQSGPSLCVERHVHTGRVTRRPEVGLVVSTLEPRKNPEFLFNWFHGSPLLPPNAELWWVGSIGWLTSRRDLKQFERRPGSRRRIRFLGVVSDSALCRLYRSVGWTIYPSLYEGFGFPVLDSLRHGTPVLASYNSSLREFDSPGLHHFDPCDASTVDDAWRALQNEGRIEIPREPLDQQFDWQNVARTLLESVEPLSANGPIHGVHQGRRDASEDHSRNRPHTHRGLSHRDEVAR
jgi:glycosyltransferase involved in cell wall biosynthesis